MPKATLSVRDVAEFFGCCETTIRRRIRAGELDAVKFGRGWRITREAVARLWARLYGETCVEHIADGDAPIGIMVPPGAELDGETFREVLNELGGSSIDWRQVADELFDRGIPAVAVNAIPVEGGERG